MIALALALAMPAPSPAAETAADPEAPQLSVQIRVQWEHAARITAVAFSPDGRVIASGDEEGVVILRDAVTGAHEGTMAALGGPVQAVAFSSDGKLRAAASPGNGEWAVWDESSGQVAHIPGEPRGLSTAALFSPDGAFLAAGSSRAETRAGGSAAGASNPIRARTGRNEPAPVPLRGPSKITLWNVRSRQIAHEFEDRAVILPAGLTPDGRVLVAASDDGRILSWNTATGEAAPPLAADSGIGCAALSPDGKLLAAASHGPSASIVTVWERQSGGMKRRLLALHCRLLAITFSENGLLAGAGPRPPGLGGGNEVYIWDVTTGVRRALPYADQTGRYAVAFSPGGRLLATTSDRAIRLWRADSGEYARVPAGSAWEGLGGEVALSPDGKVAATAEMHSPLLCWDTQTGARLTATKVPAAGSRRLAFTPDGRYLVCAAGDGGLHVFSADGSALVRSVTTDQGDPRALAFSADGRMMISSTGRWVNIWDAQSWTCLKRLALDGVAGDAALSDDGVTLAVSVSRARFSLGAGFVDFIGGVVGGLITGGPAGGVLGGAGASGRVTGHRVELWDLASRRRLHSLSGGRGGVETVAFAPGGRLLIGGGMGGTARTWDTLTGKLTGTITRGSSLCAAIASPDGRLLATEQGLWELASGAPWRRLPFGVYSALRFSADGKRLAAVGRHLGITVVTVFRVE